MRVVLRAIVAMLWIIVSGTIIPIIHQTDTIGPTTQDGIADIVQSLFLSPKAPGPGGDHLGCRPRLPVSVCERRADRTGEVRSRSDGGRPPPGERLDVRARW
jgi:hypothetical protein